MKLNKFKKELEEENQIIKKLLVSQEGKLNKLTEIIDLDTNLLNEKREKVKGKNILMSIEMKDKKEGIIKCYEETENLRKLKVNKEKDDLNMLNAFILFVYVKLIVWVVPALFNTKEDIIVDSDPSDVKVYSNPVTYLFLLSLKSKSNVITSVEPNHATAILEISDGLIKFVLVGEKGSGVVEYVGPPEFCIDDNFPIGVVAPPSVTITKSDPRRAVVIPYFIGLRTLGSLASIYTVCRFPTVYGDVYFAFIFLLSWTNSNKVYNYWRSRC